MTKVSAPCVVCGANAKTKPTTGDYIEINCPDCGEFQASWTYQTVALALPHEVRRRSLESARIRARYGMLPMITSYDLP